LTVDQDPHLYGKGALARRCDLAAHFNEVRIATAGDTEFDGTSDALLLVITLSRELGTQGACQEQQ
jgi:hypothetical protein